MDLKHIDLKFSPNEYCCIVSLDIIGRVTGIYISSYGITYNVNYFMNGDQKSANLTADEITKKRA